MALNVKPLADRVVVKPLDEDIQEVGGIIIPDTAKEKPQQGEVIAVGPGALTDDGSRKPMEVNAGDKILYGKWTGSEVRIDADDFLIMRESDILAII
ncbi:co-chaperone GroES [Gemmatimonadota bacterium]